jgi:predicted porin
LEYPTVRFHLSLLTLSILCVGSSAIAQSSVTLYGRINTSIERQKAGDTTKWAEVDNNSRFGFRGVEDLGAGANAGFALESGFASDTGVSGGGSTFFNRRSELFLGKKNLGTLRLGRWTSDAYFATADVIGLHNHDTGSSSDLLYAGFQRTNNTIGYRTPEIIPGLEATAAVSLGERVNPNLRDFSVSYRTGGLSLGLGYNKFLSATSIAKNDKASQVAVRALYNIGAFTVGGYYQRDRDARASGDRDNLRLAAMYATGPWEFHLNAGVAGNTGEVAQSGARQYTIATNYNLSKRTKVYAFATRLDDKAARLYGGDTSSLAVGVRHNF